MKNDENKLLIILPGLLMGTYWGLIKVPLPALSELAHYFHTNYHRIQQVFSIAFAITGISAIFWGPVIDKFNPKKFIWVIAIGIIIVSILLSFTTTLYAFSLLFGLCCIMTAALMILARTLPILCFSDEAVIRKSLSNIMLCGYLCAWLAPLISGYLIRYTSWRSIFFIIPILLLFIIFATQKIPQHVATTHQKKRFIENIRSMKHHLKLPSFSQNVMILAFSASFAQSSLICVPFWVTSHYHPSSDIIAYLILLMLMPGFFAPIINKFFIHKFPQNLVMFINALIIILGGIVAISLSYLLPAHYWWWVIPAIMANLTLNISFPIVHLNGFRKITSNHNTAASIISFTAYVSGGLGIYIGSFISLATAYIYGGLMIAAGIAIYFIYQLDHKSLIQEKL